MCSLIIVDNVHSNGLDIIRKTINIIIIFFFSSHLSITKSFGTLGAITSIRAIIINNKINDMRMVVIADNGWQY